ncbi:DUF6278 family protein [Streptomyces sp. Ru87]|uniref:DUF6278 family protein n=1 Tax=Streptomyces sp. Ru87 TaxID=2044307 RepID=UPI000BF718F8|nr:DUF6278 family protein [Streptomyces sp. Ru87]PGH47865.1 hypothetical protein CRI70_26125 [Streptomyces sp. Ru87]
MNIPFLGNWRKRNDGDRPVAVRDVSEDVPAGRDGADRRAEEPAHGTGGGTAGDAGVAELLAECELLRARAEDAGIELDDTPESLEALDQLLPRWRDDPEELPWLGNDAGLYLGTVVVRTVPGASWHIWPGGGPVVRLVSGRELNVVETGLDWAVTGAPELSQVYAEVRSY